jgi:hypothetical protein
MASMEDSIAQVLTASMSSDISIREHAELSLTQGGTTSGFGVGLCRVALNQALPYGRGLHSFTSQRNLSAVDGMGVCGGVVLPV